MSTYKLTYFDCRARGELIRYILAANDVSFDDVRLQHGPEWEAVKKDSPFGQLPYLTKGDKVLAQSLTIARYLAREFGLCSKSSWEQALVEQYTDLCQDILNKYTKIVYEAEGEQAQVRGMKSYMKELIPHYLTIFETALQNNNGIYMVGNSLTLADLAVLDGLDTAVLNDPNILDKYPRLSAHRKMLTELPGLRKYLDTHEMQEC